VSQHERKLANSELFDKKLVAYALAAGAGLAIAGQNANAAVIYTDAHIPINSTVGTLSVIDLDNDGIPEFAVAASHCSCASSANHFLSFLNLPFTGVMGASNSGSANASALPVGTPIDALGNFIFAVNPLAYAARFSSGSSTYGTFANAGEKFLGLVFVDANNQTHYGWARFNVIADPTMPEVRGQLIDYAYEDLADTGIEAGAAPEPGSLSMLALGAAGLAAWRSRRKAS